jgi:hypothetical protein
MAVEDRRRLSVKLGFKAGVRSLTLGLMDGRSTSMRGIHFHGALPWRLSLRPWGARLRHFPPVEACKPLGCNRSPTRSASCSALAVSRLNSYASFRVQPNLPHSRRGSTSIASSSLQTAEPVAGDATGDNGASAVKLCQGPSFQEAIRRLQQYWADLGCAIFLPHNTEVCWITYGGEMDRTDACARE